MVTCPVCGHGQQVVNISQECTIEDEWLVNEQGTFDRNIITSMVNRISCSKCNLTLWTQTQGWKDWSNTTLYWDETFQRLEQRRISVPTRKHQGISEDAFMKALQGLRKEDLASILTTLEKEKQQCQ